MADNFDGKVISFIFARLDQPDLFRFRVILGRIFILLKNRRPILFHLHLFFAGRRFRIALTVFIIIMDMISASFTVIMPAAFICSAAMGEGEGGGETENGKQDYLVHGRAVSSLLQKRQIMASAFISSAQ